MHVCAQAPMPPHGCVSGSVIRHIAIPLKKTPPATVQVARAPIFSFLETFTIGLVLGNTSEVSTCDRVGNKKNGARIFNGTKVFKAWSCLSHGLS